MPDKPILFSGAMVRALLDGPKSQTRRMLKPQPDCDHGIWPDRPTRMVIDSDGAYCDVCGAGIKLARSKWGVRGIRVPYAVGDRLYVREAWRCRSIYDRKPGKGPTPKSWVVYEADAPHEHGLDIGRLRPSIHMPRWASRLTLTVTEVRCQRLQDISEEDAVAEGVDLADAGGALCYRGYQGAPVTPNPAVAFRDLWNSINGPGAWALNPWCWAYSFTVQRGNIDALKAA